MLQKHQKRGASAILILQRALQQGGGFLLLASQHADFLMQRQVAILLSRMDHQFQRTGKAPHVTSIPITEGAFVIIILPIFGQIFLKGSINLASSAAMLKEAITPAL